MNPMATVIVIVCLTLAACAPSEIRVEASKLEEEKPRQDCPPLPLLSQDATRFEKRVWEMTVIELYRQCAESKK